jgi:hypothetical protein
MLNIKQLLLIVIKLVLTLAPKPKPRSRSQAKVCIPNLEIGNEVETLAPKP